MDSPQPRSGWGLLLAGLHVPAAASVALLSVGWASAPYEHAPRGTGDTELVLIGLSAAALITGVSAARQFFRGNSARATARFAVSAVSLAAWAIAASLAL